jgi:hypothetical protein
MSVIQVICFPERYQDLSKITITDDSIYGTVFPDRRQDAARVLVPAKMDEEQALTFIENVINSTPLATVSWTIDSAGDGAYRVFYFNIGFYDSGTSYVGETLDADGKVLTYANIIYDNAVFYKAKGTSFSAIQPGVTSGWATHWDIYDPIDLKNQIKNTKLDIHIHDDIVTAKYEDCILDKVDCLTDETLCGVCVDEEKMNTIYKMEFILDAANSNNWQEKATRSEVILKEALKKYCNCSC